ncbi:MAG: hypothetical protein IPG72_03915 [Ardenticatenales bacterium]|nr:hypothetical protein [Ardenticatenales bacterium]
MNDWTMLAPGGDGAPGQWLYLGAMVTGLALALLIALQIVLAATARLPRAAWLIRRLPLARHAPAAARAIEARDAHKLLGRLIVALVLVHPLLYLSAVTVRIGHWAPDKLWHAFTDRSYYGDSLVLGLAGVAVVAALGTAAMRLRVVPSWHGLVRLGVLLGGWHALRIGSHVRDGAGGALLRVGMALIVLDGAVRLGMSGRRWWRRRVGAAVAATSAADAAREVRTEGLEIA